jgi:hypothetical protein
VDEIINNIEEKIVLFVKKYKKLVSCNLLLEEENKNLSNELNSLQEKIVDLEEKVKLMNMSKSVKGSQEEVKLTRIKINEYVREIDKCIAFLNQ